MIFSGANTDEIFGVHRSELRPLEASDRSTGLQAGLAAIYCGAPLCLDLVSPAGTHTGSFRCVARSGRVSVTQPVTVRSLESA